jgi:hypothetical protein
MKGDDKRALFTYALHQKLNKQINIKCRATGMNVLLENINENMTTECPACGKVVKVRIADGGFDGFINNRPKYFYLPYHKRGEKK